MTSFYSELTALSSDINISCFYKLPKIGENLIEHQVIALVFDQDFAIFTLRSKHRTLYISRLTILS